MDIFVEIRAAEGGDDSKLFVQDLAKSYIKMAQKFNWLISCVHAAPGRTVLRVTGAKYSDWLNEAGGHRIQRIPPTEKRGRVHTSTVTVAILDYNPSVEIEFREQDCTISWFSGTGPGGQNRNKVQACCRVTHAPSGITVTAQTRSRKNSLNQAISELKSRLKHTVDVKNSSILNRDRKQQVGSGQRGDKKRTIQFQHNQAIDHETDKRCTAEQYLRGEMFKLWPTYK